MTFEAFLREKKFGKIVCDIIDNSHRSDGRVLFYQNLLNYTFHETCPHLKY